MTRSSLLPLQLALLAGLLVLAGCSATGPGPKAAQERLTAPSPSPSPSPAIEPVSGSFEVEADDASWNDQLGLADDGAPTGDSVDDAAQAVTNALDQFLDGAQQGQPRLGRLHGGWLRDVDPAAAEVLEQGLANPDNPVDAAHYRMRVQLEPDPTLLAADVRLDRRDGTSVSIELVFDVSGVEPRLELVGAAEAT